MHLYLYLYSYRIRQLIVPSVSCFVDLGVSYLKLRFKPHIDQMVAKASLRAKLILKSCQSRDPQLLTIEGVGPYGTALFFWKRLQGLWSHPYRSRLAKLGLDSLYCRRVKLTCLCVTRFCITGYILTVITFFRARASVVHS